MIAIWLTAEAPEEISERFTQMTELAELGSSQCAWLAPFLLPTGRSEVDGRMAEVCWLPTHT